MKKKQSKKKVFNRKKKNLSEKKAFANLDKQPKLVINSKESKKINVHGSFPSTAP